MKNLLMIFGLVLSFCAAYATELPEPKVRVLPQEYGWFDAYAIVWENSEGNPCEVEILNSDEISVQMNLTEDVEILAVQTVDYQESESSKVYSDSQLVVYLTEFQLVAGNYYTLTIPARSVNVVLSDTETVPNEEVVYSFTLQADPNIVTLPAPDINPEPGTVQSLNEITMSWTGKLGTLDLININPSFDYDTNPYPVCMTVDSEETMPLEVDFDWSDRSAVTSGAQGDILVITIPEEEIVESGEILITIAAGFLQISDVETGTLYNDEIELRYIVEPDFDLVSGLEVSEKDQIIYDLSGKRIEMNFKELGKGIYIVNGKKFVKK